MDLSSAILSVLLAEPRHVSDRLEPENERGGRLAMLAEAIDSVARSREQAALLIAMAVHESRLARYVAEGRCSEGPKGAQCDPLGGVARSRGYWQNRKVSCRPGWAEEAGSREELFAMAACSARLLWGGYVRCGTAEGAFAAANGSTSCKAPWAKSRVRTYRRVLGQLWSVRERAA